MAKSTSRDDKKTTGLRSTERGSSGKGKGLLRSVRLASTRVREDLSPWSSLLSLAVSSANEAPWKTCRDGSFLFRERWSSFPKGSFEQLDKLPRYEGAFVAFRDVRNP